MHVCTQGKELDYEAMGREQRQLAAIIRDHMAGRRAEPADKLIMRAQVWLGARGIRKRAF